jgi:peptide/nickel transport system substrate-binding protein
MAASSKTSSRLRRLKSAAVLGVVCAIAAAFAAAGASPTASASPSASGTLRVAFRSIDHLDPALAYGGGWLLIAHVYAPLVSYRHASGPAGTELVPQLVSALPKLSNGNKLYTFQLRPGLKYSDGTPIVASDFKYAMQRLFVMNSPGVGFYTNIVGAAGYAKTKKGGISGITVNDKTGLIRVRLVKPRGDFLNALALPFAAPVPHGTPMTDQSTTPIPASGQFEIKSYDPSRSFTLVRNPLFHPVPGVPAATISEVSGTLITDQSQALQMALSNQVDWDQVGVPSDRVASIKASDPSQLKLYQPAGTQMLFLNESLPPFDNVLARRAVAYAVDRNAVVALAGGLATPTQNILPPGYPSYKQISVFKPDLALAKKLIAQAHATGASVRVLGDSGDAFSSKVVTYVADQLAKIGLKPKIKLVDDSVFFEVQGSKATKANIGYVQWYQDYPHPLDWFDTLVNGNNLQPTGNINASFADIGALNRAIERLKLEPRLTPSVNAAWAKVDRDAVVKYVTYIPLVNLVRTDFFASTVNTKCYTVLSIWRFDFTQACLK